MNEIDLFLKASESSVCGGTGLIALDVIINGKPNLPPRLFAGGSCGNVLTILSFLGWETHPIARLSDDSASKMLLRDLRRWKVRTSLVKTSRDGSTPIIIEKIGQTKNGIPWHRFEWICPSCGAWLPRYKPILFKNIQGIIKKMPKQKVFYLDRVSRGSVELVKESRNNGALIFFEPSGVKDEKLFLSCLQLTDILKYSHEKLECARALMLDNKVPLEIETLGAAGIRYRTKEEPRKWRTLSAYPVSKFKDTAGAGDWCSAGIIHVLGRKGRLAFQNLKEEKILSALNFGQALAALNCYFEGARGSMYNLTKLNFKHMLKNITTNNQLCCNFEAEEGEKTKRVFKSICPACLEE